MPESRPTRWSFDTVLWTIVAFLFTLLFFFPLYWAISTALRPPRGSPMGARRRESWSSVSPSSRRRSLRCSRIRAARRG